MSKKTYVGLYVRVKLKVEDIEIVGTSCPNNHIVPPGYGRNYYCPECGAKLVDELISDIDIIDTNTMIADDIISTEDVDRIRIIPDIGNVLVEYLIIDACNGFYLDRYNSSVSLDFSDVTASDLVAAEKQKHAELLDRLSPLYEEIKIIYGILQYYD